MNNSKQINLVHTILFCILLLQPIFAQDIVKEIGPVHFEQGLRVRFYEVNLPSDMSETDRRDYMENYKYATDDNLLGQVNGVPTVSVNYLRYHNDFIHGFYIDPDEIKQFVVEFRGYFLVPEEAGLSIRWSSPFVKKCLKSLQRDTECYIRLRMDVPLNETTGDTLCTFEPYNRNARSFLYSPNDIGEATSVWGNVYTRAQRWYAIRASVLVGGEALDGLLTYDADGNGLKALTAETTQYSPDDNYEYFDENSQSADIERCPVFDGDNFVPPREQPPYSTKKYSCITFGTKTTSSETTVATSDVPTDVSSSASIIETSSTEAIVETSSSEIAESSATESSGIHSSSETLVESSVVTSSISSRSSEEVSPTSNSEQPTISTPPDSSIETSLPTSSPEFTSTEVVTELSSYLSSTGPSSTETVIVTTTISEWPLDTSEVNTTPESTFHSTSSIDTDSFTGTSSQSELPTTFTESTWSTITPDNTDMSTLPDSVTITTTFETAASTSGEYSSLTSGNSIWETTETTEMITTESLHPSVPMSTELFESTATDDTVHITTATFITKDESTVTTTQVVDGGETFTTQSNTKPTIDILTDVDTTVVSRTTSSYMGEEGIPTSIVETYTEIKTPSRGGTSKLTQGTDTDHQTTTLLPPPVSAPSRTHEGSSPETSVDSTTVAVNIPKNTLPSIPVYSASTISTNSIIDSIEAYEGQAYSISPLSSLMCLFIPIIAMI